MCVNCREEPDTPPPPLERGRVLKPVPLKPQPDDALRAPENPVAAVPTLGTPGNQPSDAHRRPDDDPESSQDLLSALDSAIRKARAAQAAVTKLQRSHATGFRIGDKVTTNTPRSPRFHNRVGVVVTTNLGEVGVSFNAKDTADAWFLPTELTRIRTTGLVSDLRGVRGL